MTNSRLLAHDMEEEGDMKLNIYYWALGSEWLQHYKELDNSRNDLWKAMEFSALVTRECCKEVCPKQFT
jgi:Iap family predicted aminopeptidase